MPYWTSKATYREAVSLPIIHKEMESNTRMTRYCALPSFAGPPPLCTSSLLCLQCPLNGSNKLGRLRQKCRIAGKCLQQGWPKASKDIACRGKKFDSWLVRPDQN
jgi:hypothetical protein